MESVRSWGAVDSQGLLALGLPGCSPVFPVTFKKGQFLAGLVGLLPPNRYEWGWVRRPWAKNPLFGGGLSMGVPCLTPWA